MEVKHEHRESLRQHGQHEHNRVRSRDFNREAVWARLGGPRKLGQTRDRRPRIRTLTAVWHRLIKPPDTEPDLRDKLEGTFRSLPLSTQKDLETARRVRKRLIAKGLDAETTKANGMRGWQVTGDRGTSKGGDRR